MIEIYTIVIYKNKYKIYYYFLNKIYNLELFGMHKL